MELTNNLGQRPDACDVEDAFVSLCCPGPDGDPFPGPEGCTRIPVLTETCVVNNFGCTPTAEAVAGIDLPASGVNDKSASGLVSRIRTNPGVTTVRAEARLEDGYLLCALPPPSTGEPQGGRSRRLEAAVGECREPGEDGLQPCSVGEFVEISRCTDASCRDDTALTSTLTLWRGCVRGSGQRPGGGGRAYYSQR